MATAQEWSTGYARQANADFDTFNEIQGTEAPLCHKMQFLQMACEKLVKAHLCSEGANPATLQTSHAFVAGPLPVVLRQKAIAVNMPNAQVQKLVKQARHLAHEIEMLAPAVKRDGQRPDNCEYPWEDGNGTLHVPLDWTFTPSLLLAGGGRTFLKLVRLAISDLL